MNVKVASDDFEASAVQMHLSMSMNWADGLKSDNRADCWPQVVQECTEQQVTHWCKPKEELGRAAANSSPPSASTAAGVEEW